MAVHHFLQLDGGNGTCLFALASEIFQRQGATGNREVRPGVIGDAPALGQDVYESRRRHFRKDLRAFYGSVHGHRKVS